MSDINDKLYKAYDTSNRLAAEAAKLEKERDQLKKELYNLRKAVWSLDLTDKFTLDSALKDHATISCTRSAEVWAEIDSLMGDWYPGKEDNSGDNPVAPHPDSIPKLPKEVFNTEIPKPFNVPQARPHGKTSKDSKLFDKTEIYPTDEIGYWPEED